MAISPTDANNYIGPSSASDTVSPGWPKWLYHPVNAPVIVADSNAEAALQAADSRWSETDPNATP